MRFPEWSPSEQVRVLIPVFAVGAAILAAVADPSSGADLGLCGLAAAPFLVWIFRPRIPLLVLPVYGELGLGDREVGDDEAIALMTKHPELMQRPVVVRGDRAVLARPVERVQELLP